jgi:hypothetical protein
MNRDPRFALSQELEAKQMAPQKRLLPNRRQSEAQAPAHSIRRRRGCSVARRHVPRMFICLQGFPELEDRATELASFMGEIEYFDTPCGRCCSGRGAEVG